MNPDFASPSAGRRAGIAVLATCAVLVAPYPTPLDGWALIPIFALVGLNVVLVKVTGGLAFALTDKLDERQNSARDRAFRLGFRLGGLAILLVLVAAILGSYPARGLILIDSSFTQAEGIDARFLVTTLELLLMMPTLVLALSGAAHAGATEPILRRGPMPRSLLIGMGAALLTVLGWMTLFVAGPSQMMTQRIYPGRTSLTDGKCADYLSRDEAGLGMAGPLRMRAEVCWNGRVAFVLGAGPGLDAPTEVPDFARLSSPSAGGVCGIDPDQQELVRIAANRCSETIDADGTLHYSATGQVYPGPFPIAGRTERLEVVVTRDGRLLKFTRT
ncbi:MAG TPA: hypothetical protein VIN56_05115 [Candidatus Dormibacteraeota bacterium]